MGATVVATSSVADALHVSFGNKAVSSCLPREQFFLFDETKRNLSEYNFCTVLQNYLSKSRELPPHQGIRTPYHDPLVHWCGSLSLPADIRWFKRLRNHVRK